MKTLLKALTFTVFITGCTSTTSVVPEGKVAQYHFNTLNERIGKRECTIVLASGEMKQGKEIVLSEDSTSFLAPVRRVVSALQVSVVDRIRGERKAEITFMDGQKISSEEVTVTHDSVSWMGQARLTIPTSQIRKIIYVSHADGLIDGLYVGVGGGLGALGLYALAWEPGDVPQIYPLIGAYIGVGVFFSSPIVGAVVGHTEVFEFRLAKQSTGAQQQ